MKLTKQITLLSMAALMGVSPLFVTNNSMVHTVHAADTTVKKVIMHTAIAYDKNGNATKLKYIPYGTVMVESKIVTINNSSFYKISDQDPAFKASGLSEGYIKVTNIDGVKRKLTHNAYIYRTSTGRTSYSGRWKLYKGETITTYGGSYKFKNGKRYFRVGGPRKQYIKSYNLGPVISTNTSDNANSSSNSRTVQSTNSEEATATVIQNGRRLFDANGKMLNIKIKKGDQFIVDKAITGSPVDRAADAMGEFVPDAVLYHIKGTDNWLYSVDVKVNKKLPVHNYNFENFSYITFPQDTDVYNSNGTLQDHNGQKISKQKGNIKVDKLVYLWVPNENKAELFYHLAETSLYASESATSKGSTIDVGKDAYVKASDVKFIEKSKNLTPSNTAEEAKAAYEASQSSNK